MIACPGPDSADQSGQLLRHLKQFVDGVPVSSRAGAAENLSDAGPRKLGAAHTFGEINVDFFPIDLHFFGTGIDLFQFLQSSRTRFLGKKCDEQFPGMNVVAFGEGISGECLGQLRISSQNNGWPKSSLSLDCVFNLSAPVVLDCAL